MSEEAVTPAGRLLELVQAGRRYKGDTNRKSSAVWAEVLGVEPGSPEFLRLVADVNRMIADLVGVVSATPMKEHARENYLETLRHFLNVFQTPTMRTPWKSTQQSYLTDPQLDSLENLDNHLHLADLHSGPKLAEQQVEEIRHEVDHVLELLDGSDLPDGLTRLLRSHVQAIRRVVQHYRIYGNDGLHDELRRILGDLNVHHETFKRHGEDGAVRAFKGLLAKAAILSRLLGPLEATISVAGALKRLFGPD